MGDMSGEYAGRARTGMFSASRKSVAFIILFSVYKNVYDIFIDLICICFI